MDDLFSCRKCIHNAAQTLSIGRGVGFCQMHESVILSPEKTTCKYLARKDLPSFSVDEGVKEHAYEFAMFTSLVDTETMKLIKKVFFSEKHLWQTNTFYPLILTLAHSRLFEPKRLFIESLAGNLDGRRGLAHASNVGRYMTNCDTWVSSYRLVLAMVQSFGSRAEFSATDLSSDDGNITEARWDLFFVRISGLQEYGFHSGLESLLWATDDLGDAFVELNWIELEKILKEKRKTWTESIIRHARDEGEVFPRASEN